MNNKYEKVSCPTCDGYSRKELIHKRDDDIGFYKCLHCNIEYASHVGQLTFSYLLFIIFFYKHQVSYLLYFPSLLLETF